MFALHTAPPLEVSEAPEAYIVISELQGVEMSQIDGMVTAGVQDFR